MFDRAPRLLLLLLGLNVLAMFVETLAQPNLTAGSFVGVGLYLYLVWSALNGRQFAVRFLGPITVILGMLTLIAFVGMLLGGPLSRLMLILLVPPTKLPLLTLVSAALQIGTGLYLWRSKEVSAYLIANEKFVF